MKIKLETKVKSLTLKRYPFKANENLQAWDASDEYLLNHLSENGFLESDKKILICNDTFGALTLSLNDFNPDTTSDSFLAYEGIKSNAKENGISFSENSFIKSTQELSKKYDLVLIKLPKNTSYLEDFLCRITPHLSEGAQVITTAMVKHLHSSTLKIYEKVLGETKTSLAVKKARLVFTKLTNTNEVDSKFPKKLFLETKKVHYINHSNVFSREKLDIGTRFFIEHLPKKQDDKVIVDLGCGNGLLSVCAAYDNPKAKFKLFDESFMAITSAKENCTSIHPETSFETFWSDCLDGYEDKADIVLCNPPFHQQNVIGDHIAWKMFTGSHRILNKGGKLRIVGNRHLKYHVKLKKIFGNCETVASNDKFVIFEATKN